MTGPSHHHAPEQVRIDCVLLVQATRVRPWGSFLWLPQKRMPGVFGVDRRQQRQGRFGGRVRRIDGGAGHTRQFALSGQSDGIMGADPLPAMCHRVIPDFF